IDLFFGTRLKLFVTLAIAGAMVFGTIQYWRAETYKARLSKARQDIAVLKDNQARLEASIKKQNQAVDAWKAQADAAAARFKQARARAEKMRQEADQLRQSILSAKPLKSPAAVAWANLQYQKIIGGTK
ncbi:MAG: hypothetical protein KJ621_08585, partial [Proteobacteria bacterium]|nr:hypothetical protein [Pseudomonadota bacterium]